MKKGTLIILILLIILAGAVGAYWYFFMKSGVPGGTTGTGTTPNNPFNPLNRPNPPIQTPTQKPPGATSTPIINQTGPGGRLPVLRLLSNSPIGGYGASTTASTTAVRWIDRGRGNIYEALGDSGIVTTLSNTIVPRMYESAWNKYDSAFIGSLFQEGMETPSIVYAELVRLGTSTSFTPYELKGKNLPGSVIAYAPSPKRDRVFLFAIVNGRGVGFISAFDGKNVSQIFDTPVTKVNIEWPEDNTIAITTKGSASIPGFLYFVDPKSGIWRKILGPIPGLSARTSHDAKHVLVSSTGPNQNIFTNIYDVAKGTSDDATIRTLADKCAWGNYYKDVVYCAVPSQQTIGTYPDDWYEGIISFSDKIWQVSATTGSVKLVSSILDESDRIIDGFNLGVDARDDFLYFMNKRDLSFWSLDLVRK